MSFLGIKNPFRTGAGGVTDAASTMAAGQQGRAANLTTLANSWFDDPNRATQRGTFMDALRTQLADTTNRGFADTARNTKFATARQGLTGGRVDVDRQRRNIEDLFRRRIANEAQVQDAGNQLRTRDLATRQSLIGSAYGAADVGADASRQLIGQRADNANYLSTLLPSFINSTGSDLASAYSRRAMLDEFRRGLAGGYTSG